MTTPGDRPVGAGPDPRGIGARVLSLLAEVRPGEATTVLLLTLNVFLLLCSYYLLKSAREPLILTQGGAEVKTYASAGQAILLIGMTAVYGSLARRFGRMRLISVVTLFFASNLLLFSVVGRAGVAIGVPFYLWVGVFNMSIVAQFWGFAADVYTAEQGKRLFAIVGVGSSVGALVGARIAKWLVVPIGPYGMMLVAACVLLVCLGLTAVTHRREAGHVAAHKREPDQPLSSRGGFSLLLRDRYLLLIAALTLLLNWVNTIGEYVLDRTLLAAAASAAGGLTSEQFIGVFKASYFGWVNFVGVALQLVVVSRIFKYLGVRVALFFLPLVALGGYGVMGIAPVLSLVFVAKVAENSLDYSVQNTARQALFLVTSREAKYTAKAVIDTFVVRTGDVLAAITVWLGSRLALSSARFAWVNVALIVLWLCVLVALVREHRRRSELRGA
ncbi:MAG: MFS transporter [Deltaproteobacteria bacterium]|nr:MFS transporter [Deltaproteobacteria bacterium]